MDNILHNSFIFSNFTKTDRVDLQPTQQGYPDSPSVFENIYRGNILIRDNMKRLSIEELPEVNSERWLSLEDLDGEVWKRIDEYNRNYSVSNYGRVKSHARYRHTGNGGRCLTKEHIMRLTLLKTKGGYWYVSIHSKNGESSHKEFVHRLVGKYFVPNISGEKYINHKDENSRNNIFYNLEWCSIAHNNSYGTARARAQATRIRKGIAKTVGQFNGSALINVYSSLTNAAKSLGVNKGTLSYYCLREREYKNGYLYKYI